MVASKKQGIAEQSKNSSIVSVEKLYKKQLREATACLRRHEPSRAPVLEFLRANNWGISDEPQTRDGSFETKARQAKAQKAKDAKAKAKGAEGSDARDLIPENIGTLGKMPWKVLAERILPTLQKTTLSTSNLGMLYTKSAKADAKQLQLLKLLEYLTGEGPGLELKEELAKWSGLVLHLQKCSSERGRIDADNFPPDYQQTGGVYEIHDVYVEESEVCLRHKFSKEKVTLAVASFPYVPDFEKTFKIQSNWSEVSATLHFVDVDGSRRQMRIGTFFKNQCAKKRLMIADAKSPPSSGKRRRGGNSPGAASA